jgi:hypothetical protein
MTIFRFSMPPPTVILHSRIRPPRTVRASTGAARPTASPRSARSRSPARRTANRRAACAIREPACRRRIAGPARRHPARPDGRKLCTTRLGARLPRQCCRVSRVGRARISRPRLYEVAITPVGVQNGAIASIRPAEDRHLDAAIVIFPLDPPVAGRAPILEYLGWFGHRLQCAVCSGPGLAGSIPIFFRKS